jgi:ribosomal protein L27
LEAPAEVDPGKSAMLRPVSEAAIRPGTGKQPIREPFPWKLRLPGRNRRPGGMGQNVAAKRRKVAMERISRQRGYRFSGSANRGHGRNRALRPIWCLQQAWKDFVKTANYVVAKDVVRQCVENGIGTLYYFQPGGSVKDTRFLTNAGKVQYSSDGRIEQQVRESTGWDWYQMGHRLSTLCEDVGISFRWVKPDRRVVRESTVKIGGDSGTSRKSNHKLIVDGVLQTTP